MKAIEQYFPVVLLIMLCIFTFCVQECVLCDKKISNLYLRHCLFHLMKDKEIHPDFLKEFHDLQLVSSLVDCKKDSKTITCILTLIDFDFAF